MHIDEVNDRAVIFEDGHQVKFADIVTILLEYPNLVKTLTVVEKEALTETIIVLSKRVNGSQKLQETYANEGWASVKVVQSFDRSGTMAENIPPDHRWKWNLIIHPANQDAGRPRILLATPAAERRKEWKQDSPEDQVTAIMENVAGHVDNVCDGTSRAEYAMPLIADGLEQVVTIQRFFRKDEWEYKTKREREADYIEQALDRLKVGSVCGVYPEVEVRRDAESFRVGHWDFTFHEAVEFLTEWAEPTCRYLLEVHGTSMSGQYFKYGGYYYRFDEKFLERIMETSSIISSVQII